MRKYLAVAIATMLIGGAPGGASTPSSIRWQPDLVHSRAEFTVSHLVVSKVWGHIPITSMVLVTPAGSVIPSKIEATLNVSHEDTDNRDRDADLRSPTYFDVARYPTISFRSTKIAPKGPVDCDVTGELTIKGITHTITFPVHVEGRVPDESGGVRVGYTGQVHIDRRDYGINDNRLSSVGVLLVGYDVAIGLTAEATTRELGGR